MATDDQANRAWMGRASSEGCVSGRYRDFWRDPSDVFHSKRHDEDDETDLRQAALEKLNGSKSTSFDRKEVDFVALGEVERNFPINRILEMVEEENGRLLRRLKERLNSAGIELPKIEIRFENLSVDADAYVRTSALPTLLNSVTSAVEGFLGFLGFPVSKKVTNKVLTNISGILRPSRMVLLLGPPGAGKTTLLRVLAGKRDKDLRVSGKVTYCGHELSEFVPQRTAAYIGQRDVHLGEMTVRETLDFSWRCQGSRASHEMLSELVRKEQEMSVIPDPEVYAFAKVAIAPDGGEQLITDYILKMLGLEACADILVGDELRRGISGGQKKRLTSGEMLVGPARALFMDAISNGLDTTTTFQIVKFMRQIVLGLDATVVMSLLQPAPEVFDLFDDVIVLNESEIMYQGPREKVLDFFGSMGFSCPGRTGIPDFLLRLASRKYQAQYWAKVDEPYKYVSIHDFVNTFECHHLGQQLRADLEKPYDKSKAHPAAISTDKHGGTSMEIFRACLAREWLIMKRDSFIYIFKACQILFLAGLGSSVFPRTQMPHETIADAGKYFGAIFYGVVSVLFNGAAEMVMTAERLPVHYKHRDLLFYPGWAFTLPIWLLKIPISLLEVTIWVIVAYNSMGFAPSVARFFRQLLALFCLHQSGISGFRLAAAVGRSVIATTTYGTFWMVAIFVLSGFVIPKDNLGVWWIWGYWTSPIMHAQNAMAINEFLDPRWNEPANDGTLSASTVGSTFLKSRGLPVNGYWYWISIGALILLSLIYNLCFLAFSVYLNPLQAVHVTEKRDKGSKGFRPVRSSNEDGTKARTVLPFTPLALSFKNINYFVDMPPAMKKHGIEETRLQLLCDVSGAFRPGILTALMGVSGAGKTTLMDVLVGRKTGGYIEGTVYIAGYPKKQETFARIRGYCEQNDIHSPNITVYESLLFSAWLRLPSELDEGTRKLFVEEVMALIELEDLRNTLVGLPGVNGLTTEQRKRFTVAVELVANPSIIFMDEPTSGLDAGSAAVVMQTVRKMVNTGRTVVCTIHQPSIDILESFDELMLMKLGGQVIYAGPLGQNFRNLVEYFESIPGVPKIKEGQNPASWALEITTPSMEEKLKLDFADTYIKSSVYQHSQSIIEELSTPCPDSEDLFFRSKYSTNFAFQFKACFWKQYWSYWRNPSYNTVRFAATVVMALLLGSLFWSVGLQRRTQLDVMNVVGAVYCFAFFLGPVVGTSVQPVLEIERIVLYRERSAVMYSPFAYALAQVSVEVIYNASQALLFCLIFYPLVGFSWQVDKFLWFLFLTFMCFLYFAAAGMMSVAITPSSPIAAVVMILFIHLWNIFSGFFVYRPMLPRWWKWCYWTSPVAWTIYGLTVSQIGDREEILQIPWQGSMSVRTFLKEAMGYDHDFLGYIAAAHVGFAIVFSLAFALGIKFLNFERR
ncbi:ABC transporter G family member 34-like isoform X2 [Wolffia australiana]